MKVKICGIAFHSPRFDAPGRPFLRPLVDVTMAADDVGELILQSQAYSVDAPIIQMISQEFRILLPFVPNFGPRAHAAFGPEFGNAWPRHALARLAVGVLLVFGTRLWAFSRFLAGASESPAN